MIEMWKARVITFMSCNLLTPGKGAKCLTARYDVGVVLCQLAKNDFRH